MFLFSMCLSKYSLYTYLTNVCILSVLCRNLHTLVCMFPVWPYIVVVITKQKVRWALFCQFTWKDSRLKDWEMKVTKRKWNQPLSPFFLPIKDLFYITLYQLWLSLLHVVFTNIDDSFFLDLFIFIWKTF